MHVVYSNPKWRVYRLVTIPDGSVNNTAYIARGWCFFETGVASIGAKKIFTMENGDKNWGAKSPVPLTPIRFAAEVAKLHFTNGRTGADTVAELYNRIFPVLAQHQELNVRNWDDCDARKLLTVIDDLRALKVRTVARATHI